jgi:hypothetical protein
MKCIIAFVSVNRRCYEGKLSKVAPVHMMHMAYGGVAVVGTLIHHHCTKKEVSAL